MWTKNYGGVYYDQIGTVQQTNDSGYIVVGTTDTTDGIFTSYVFVLLIKTNSLGDTTWTRTMGFGGDLGYSVRQTTDGGYIVTGVNNSTFANLLLIKTDPNGNIQWSNAFGGSPADRGYSLQQTTDGGYIISGYTYAGGNGQQIYLIKTDMNGNLMWSKAFKGGYYEEGRSVKQTMDGGYVIAGYFRTVNVQDPYHIFLIRTDSSGNPLWSSKYGGLDNDRAYSVHQTTDGGFLLAGYTESFGAANSKIYLIKTDSLGNSGCNQDSFPVIVSTPTTIVTNLTMPVINPVIYVTTPVFTVDSGGTATTLCFVGINEMPDNKNEIAIFPNPTTDFLNLSFTLPPQKSFSMEIFNLYGQVVKTSPLNPPVGDLPALQAGKQEITIDIRDLPQGIYFVKLIADGKEEVRKVVKY